jgi:hypothetical protein
VPRTAKLFFIHVVHSLPGTVGHVTALKLPSQGGRARSHGARSSTGAHLIREARSGVEGQLFTLQILCRDSFRGGPFKEEKEALMSPMSSKLKLKQLKNSL